MLLGGRADGRRPAPAADTYSSRLLGKAVPDECFAGIGQPYPAGPPCAQGQAKVNQSYVWGMTRVGRQVWFGTGANTHCLTSGSGLADAQPVVNDDYVCEFAESQVAQQHPAVPDALGDVRPPQVWSYDDGVLTNRTPDDPRLRSTLGLRAAGTAHGVVLFAGPSLSGTLNVFAFDAVTKRFLGSRTLAQYGNARTFLSAAGDLYLGAGIGPDGGLGGAVLRWRGNRARAVPVRAGGHPARAGRRPRLSGRPPLRDDLVHACSPPPTRSSPACGAARRCRSPAAPGPRCGTRAATRRIR